MNYPKLDPFDSLVLDQAEELYNYLYPFLTALKEVRAKEYAQGFEEGLQFAKAHAKSKSLQEKINKKLKEVKNA